MSKSISIAIDGPSGSGKSTIASIVAKKLGFHHLNTGSLYRAYALVCFCNNVNTNNEQEVFDEISKQLLEVEFGKTQKTLLNGKAVDKEIRNENVGLIASKISTYPKVRNIVNNVIRELCDKFSLVLDGRDVGTVVLPGADLKVYLDASAECRAKRRFLQVKKSSTYQEVLENIKRRDLQDSTRAVAPLKRAVDAFYLDSSSLSIKQVCDIIINKIKEIK